MTGVWNEESTSQVTLTPAETNVQSTTAKAVIWATSPQAGNKKSTSQVTLTPADVDAQSTTTKAIIRATSPQVTNKAITTREAAGRKQKKTPEWRTEKDTTIFTTAEKNEIRELFDNVIKSNIKVYVSDVRERLAASSSLNDLLKIHGMDRKIADFLHHAQTAVLREAPDDLLVATSEQKVQEWNNDEGSTVYSGYSGQSGRLTWTDKDNNLINARFEWGN